MKFWNKFFKKTKEVQDKVVKATEGVTESDVFHATRKEFSKVSKDISKFADVSLQKVIREDWGTKGGKAKDVMEVAHKVKENDSIKKVVTALKTKEDVLVVVKGKDQLVGVIDEATLIKLLVPTDKLETEEVVGFMGAGYDKAFVAKKAGDVMEHRIFFVTPSMPIEKVAFLMYKENLRAIPVVDGSKIVGIVHVRNLIGKIK